MLAIRLARKDVERAAVPAKIKLGKVLLTDEHLLTLNGQHRSRPTCRRASTAGNLAAYAKSRSTLTRMGAGGLVLGPVGMLIGATAKKSKDVYKVDKRELYLLVEAEAWAETVELEPDKGKQARELAQASTSRHATSNRPSACAPKRFVCPTCASPSSSTTARRSRARAHRAT